MFFLLLITAALAADPEAAQAPAQQKSTGELLSDLASDDSPDRLFAARALKAQLKRSLRGMNARPGSLVRDEALATLDELDARLPDQARAALQYRNSVAPAAEMLAIMGVTVAAPEIQEQLALETRKGVRRRLEAAIATLTPQ